MVRSFTFSLIISIILITSCKERTESIRCGENLKCQKALQVLDNVSSKYEKMILAWEERMLLLDMAPDCVPALLLTLEKNRDPIAVQISIDVLGKIQHEESFDKIKNYVFSDFSYDTTKVALKAILDIDQKKAAKLIFENMEYIEEAEFKYIIVRAIGRYKTDESIKILDILSNDNSERVRGEAYEVLFRNYENKAIGIFNDRLKKESSLKLKNVLQDYLNRL